MTELLTIDRKEFSKLINKINSIDQFIREVKKNNVHSKWISEEDAMAITGLGKRSLRAKRSNGEFTYSSATGRKIKYLRTEIESYLNDNSSK